MADEGTSDERAAANADYEAPAGAETTATWMADGVSIDYIASAKWIVLRKKEKPAAEIFSVSYVANSDGGRPVTFVFNDGPGRHRRTCTWAPSGRYGWPSCRRNAAADAAPARSKRGLVARLH